MYELLSLLIGLGIFLLGMNQLEQGIRELSANHLKNWFYQYTQNPVTSAGVGILSTTILQSSSMVSLLVLAFASANILPLQSAIGILLGANLGTTFTGWIVTTIGFKLDLNTIALPLIAIAGLSQIFLPSNSKSKALTILLTGLGLLIFGLNYMKTGVAHLPERWDISQFSQYGPWFFLGFGIVTTAIIQSSSAAMMITLAALNAQIIQLPDAAALIIGADLGTTSTTILGSLSGRAIKKRLAFSHVFFNIVTDFLAFFILLPALPWLIKIIGLTDPLYSLVAFHSAFNLLGLILFMPFIKKYSTWIDGYFRDDTEERLELIALSKKVPEAIMPTLIKSCDALFFKGFSLNIRNFKIDLDQLTIKEEIKNKISEQSSTEKTFEQEYEGLKIIENEIMQAAAALHSQKLNVHMIENLNSVLTIARCIIYSCKTLKDIRENLVSLRHNESNLALAIYNKHQSYIRSLYSTLLPLLCYEHEKDYLNEQLHALLSNNNQHQSNCDKLTYEATANTTKEVILNNSSILNINREIHHATKNILLTLEPWQQLKNSMK